MVGKQKNRKAFIILRPDLEKYYEIVNMQERKLHCKLKGCETVLTYNSVRGWFNFERHLVQVHKLPEDQFIKKKAGIRDYRPSRSISYSCREDITHSSMQDLDPSMNVDSPNTTCYRDEDKQSLFEWDILDLIAVDQLPLTVSQMPGFCKLIKNINPNLEIPSPYTVQLWLKVQNEKVFNEDLCKLRLLGNQQLHLNLDLWTSTSNKSVVGFKVYFIDQDWELQCCSLGFKHFPLSKSRHDVCLYMKKQLDRMGIQPHQIGTVMADDVSDIVKAFNLEEFQSDCIEYEEFESDSEGDSHNEDKDTLEEAVTYELADFTFINDDILKCMSVPTDHVNNLMDALSDWCKVDFVRLGCIAQALQLELEVCILNNPTANEIVQYVYRILSFFSSNPKWNAKFVRETSVSLLQSGPTRWNFVVYALDQILKEDCSEKMNSVLQQCHELHNQAMIKPPHLLTEPMKNVMAEMMKLIEPFIELTTKLQGDCVTSSLAIPGIIGLYKVLTAIDVKDPAMILLKESLALNVVERFVAWDHVNSDGTGMQKQMLKILDSKHYILATILDPRFSFQPFQVVLDEPNGLEKYIPSEGRLQSILKEAVMLLFTNPAKAEPLNAEVDGMPSYEPKVICSVLEQIPSIFDIFCQPVTPCVPVPGSSSYDTEIKEYRKVKRHDISSNPLLFWQKNAGKFPILSQLARKYLCFPSTSVSMEHLISTAGTILEAKRSHAKHKSVEDVLQYRECRMKQQQQH